ncbi:MAG: ABC transporter permease [Vicinamibacteria bacterium]
MRDAIIAEHRSGRTFRAEDGPTSPGVAIINETMAQEYFRGEEPVGKRLSFPYPDLSERVFTIVGVVSDIEHDRLAAGPSRTIYLFAVQEAVSEFQIVRAAMECRPMTRLPLPRRSSLS